MTEHIEGGKALDILGGQIRVQLGKDTHAVLIEWVERGRDFDKRRCYVLVWIVELVAAETKAKTTAMSA